MPPLDMATRSVASVEDSKMVLPQQMTVDQGTFKGDVSVTTAGSAAVDEAGKRRRSRVLKMRQTRSRNAAAKAQQIYTSAEDSEDEVCLYRF